MPWNPKDYPQNWKELRSKVLTRAGQHITDDGELIEACCEDCGVENHALIHRFGKGKHDWEMWPEGMMSEAYSADGKKCTKVILTIAHLDHDKHNHDVSIDRLKALCQKCHLQYDMPRHVANRKYGRNHDKNNLKLEL